MKVLVAIKQSEESRGDYWQKVAVYNARKDGSMSLPLKYNGTLEGSLIRSGVKMLTEDTRIASVDLQHGSSAEYRVHRI